MNNPKLTFDEAKVRINELSVMGNSYSVRSADSDTRKTIAEYVIARVDELLKSVS